MCHLLAIFVLLAFAGCGFSGEKLREHTYPPSFEYIEKSRLHSAMWTLAHEMTLLEDALRHPDADAAEQQRLVGEILERVDTAVDSIAKPGHETQHQLLNQNLPQFRELVHRARSDAARTPPNYFTASALTGSCGACHHSGAV
jgi:hypothetical protein